MLPVMYSINGRLIQILQLTFVNTGWRFAIIKSPNFFLLSTPTYDQVNTIHSNSLPATHGVLKTRKLHPPDIQDYQAWKTGSRFFPVPIRSWLGAWRETRLDGKGIKMEEGQTKDEATSYISPLSFFLSPSTEFFPLFLLLLLLSFPTPSPTHSSCCAAYCWVCIVLSPVPTIPLSLPPSLAIRSGSFPQSWRFLPSITPFPSPKSYIFISPTSNTANPSFLPTSQFITHKRNPL